MEISKQDRAELDVRGISVQKYEEEVRRLKSGFPSLKIQSAATAGNGILALDEDARRKYEEVWDKYVASGAKVVKMVPASGAASRMFKNLFRFADGQSMTPDNPFIEEFFAGVHNFAFYAELDEMCRKLYALGIDDLMAAGRHRDIVSALIKPEGMNYGQLPKALLPFHSYGENQRTALEEHLAEGAQYAAGEDGVVHVHFTVSEDHIPLVEAKVKESMPVLGKQFGVTFDVTTSVQKPSTDTVALGPDGEPFRVDGKLFFRPGGHGALIENLGEIDADVVFLKNIDNVVPDSARALTVEYKKVLGGILVENAQKIANYVGELSVGLPSRPVLNEMLDYLRDTLCVTGDKAANMDELELADYLMCKFSRPLRVCGMVRNEGEPGGGPYLVYNADGTVSPQILESSQIDTSKPEGLELMSRATHFNPVDLVCDINDMEGGRFNLGEFVDPDTGFISSKSVQGVEIKALELPGLWNGAMSDWNTIFVEVPVQTFNPVKTVNDLLRPAHQS
ncbi:MAG: DUF4301 family protein [Prevotella sp.]|nr:DUF4301 family protein [Prevotella sp.]MCM1074121.1 DUF4301 family protein [Ruminococcus sp.]